MMKIEITQVEFLTDDDYVEILTIDAGDIKLEFGDSPPEDNTLKRNFQDVYKIEELIKKAYQAGRDNNGLELSKMLIVTEDEAIKKGIIY